MWNDNRWHIDFANLSLFVQVSDGQLSTTAEIAVLVSDSNDVPTLDDAVFTVGEYTVVPHVLGSLVFSDADGQSADFVIEAGDVDSVFELGLSSGQLSVVKALDYDVQQ